MSDDPIDRAIGNAEEKQEQQRDRAAQQRGQARRERIQNDPAKGGSPQDDGYGGMSQREKDAYKKGYGGS